MLTAAFTLPLSPQGQGAQRVINTCFDSKPAFPSVFARSYLPRQALRDLGGSNITAIEAGLPRTQYPHRDASRALAASTSVHYQ